MIESTFKTGNYNKWDRLVNKALDINSQFRTTIIPKVDELLTSMLGSSAVIEKTSVNVTAYPGQDSVSLAAVSYTMIYTIEDFKAPDAPEEAVKKDTQTITDYLADQGESSIRLESVNIDTNKGQLTVCYKAIIN